MHRLSIRRRRRRRNRREIKSGSRRISVADDGKAREMVVLKTLKSGKVCVCVWGGGDID